MSEMPHLLAAERLIYNETLSVLNLSSALADFRDRYDAVLYWIDQLNLALSW